MKVPLEGELVAKPDRLAPGRTTRLVLRVEALSTLNRVVLAIDLPPGLKLVKGVLYKEYARVTAHQSATIEAIVELQDSEPKRIIARATIMDTEKLALTKAFVASINAESQSPQGRPTSGSDAQGNAITIYKTSP